MEFFFYLHILCVSLGNPKYWYANDNIPLYPNLWSLQYTLGGWVELVCIVFRRKIVNHTKMYYFEIIIHKLMFGKVTRSHFLFIFTLRTEKGIEED